MTSIELKQEKKSLLDELNELNDNVAKEKRDFNATEKRLWDTLNERIKALNNEILEVEKSEADAAQRANDHYSKSLNPIVGKEYFIDTRTGKLVNVYSKRNKMVSSRNGDIDHFSLGRAIQGMVTGEWRNAEKEKRALGTAINSGHMLVPQTWAPYIVDMVRGQSIIANSGAKFVLMESETLNLVRVVSDPTFEVKVQNEAFQEGSIAFEPFALKAHTIGVIVVVSRELAYEAKNLVPQLTNIISSAIGHKLDELALFGTGEAQPLGLVNTPGIETIDLINAAELNYDHLISLWKALADNNANPTAYYVSNSDYANMISERVASGYLLPPVLLQDKIFNSSAIPTNLGTGENSSIAIGGDFSKMLVGIREDITVDVSTEGAYFDKHQVAIKITLRADIGFENPNQFGTIVNIAAPGSIE